MMRRTFVFCLLLGATMCLDDDLTEKIAELLSMSKMEVQTCVDKTNFKVADAMRMDELVNDNVETMETDSSAMRFGCLIACLLQTKEMMTGSYIDLDRIKELSGSKVHLTANQIVIRDRILDKCNDRVKGKTNECDVIIKFTMCIVSEVKQIQNSRPM